MEAESMEEVCGIICLEVDLEAMCHRAYEVAKLAPQTAGELSKFGYLAKLHLDLPEQSLKFRLCFGLPDECLMELVHQLAQQRKPRRVAELVPQIPLRLEDYTYAGIAVVAAYESVEVAIPPWIPAEEWLLLGWIILPTYLRVAATKGIGRAELCGQTNSPSPIAVIELMIFGIVTPRPKIPEEQVDTLDDIRLAHVVLSEENNRAAPWELDLQGVMNRAVVLKSDAD
jgi:hypothetical protein